MKTLTRIWAVFQKELLQLSRDRLTLGMVVMVPLIQLMLFGFAINTKLRDIPVGVVDYSHSAVARVLQQTLEATTTVHFTKTYTSETDALSAIAREEVRAVLIIPRDVSSRLARHPALGFGLPPATDQEVSRPVAQWVVDGADTMVAATLKGLRGMPLHELMMKPANRNVPTFETTLLYNPEQRSAVSIIPGLVGVILTMTMIMFTSAAIVRERERGNLELIIATPIKPVELMLGKIIPYVLIGCVQVCIILGVGHVLFGVPINGSLALVALVTLCFICATLTLGLMISTVAKSQLQAMQMTVFVLLPSILLSGFMFPYEGMPVGAQYLAEVLPATHFMRLIRGVVLKDAGIIELSGDLLWLVGFTVIGLALASLRFKKRLG